MKALLALIAILLAAILLTLLGWWNIVWTIVFAVGALVALAAPIALVASNDDRKRANEHKRLIDSLPAIDGHDAMLPVLRDAAVWDWINKGKPGDLATFVGDYVRVIRTRTS